MEPTGRALFAQVIRSEASLVARFFAPLIRLLARLRRLSDLFPWTALGVLVTALAYAALEWLAYEELDLVWLVVGYVGLGLTLLAPVLVLIAAVWLRVSSRREPRLTTQPVVLETGSWQETSFERKALWFLPLVQVRWEWLEPRGAEIQVVRRGGLLHERVRLPERGFHERIVRRIVVSDAFGLSRVRFRVQRVQPVEVRPRLGALRTLPALTALASGDALPHPMGLTEGDRLELRRYAPGDPARFIHWKVWSRTGKMMVRMPERALSVARRMAAFAIAGDEDDASIAAARLAIDQRALGQDWVLGTDAQPGGVTRADAALDALVSSIAHKADAGNGLRAFVERVEQGGPASYVLFVPPQRGAWVNAVGQMARGRALRIVIGVDGVRAQAPQPLWRRVLMQPAVPEGVDAAELERLVAELSKLGASVAVLDRGSGRALSAAHLNATARAGAAPKAAALKAEALRS